MAVEFTFTKDMASGIGKSGKMRAQVSMSLTLTDAASGRVWYSKTFSASSRDAIAVSSGGYNEEEFFGLLRAAITELSERFASHVSTILQRD
jgi:curli biogenesis system outer membrane secretion channel CsgG